jgi:hypothetical protein
VGSQITRLKLAANPTAAVAAAGPPSAALPLASPRGGTASRPVTPQVPAGPGSVVGVPPAGSTAWGHGASSVAHSAHGPPVGRRGGSMAMGSAVRPSNSTIVASAAAHRPPPLVVELWPSSALSCVLELDKHDVVAGVAEAGLRPAGLLWGVPSEGLLGLQLSQLLALPTDAECAADLLSNDRKKSILKSKKREALAGMKASAHNAAPALWS